MGPGLLIRSCALLLLGAALASIGRAATRSIARSIQEGAPPFAWGGDVNPGAGTKLVESVRAELRRFVRAKAAERPGRARRLAEQRAVAAIEGWKRFRNPELIELARACLAHADWHVAHRSLLWLTALRDPELVARALPLLSHEEARLREIAALSCLRAPVDPKRGDPPASAATARQLVDRALASERDFHVRQALRALARRWDGNLEPRTLAEEVVVDDEPPLRWAPFVRGLRNLPVIAPGAAPTAFSLPGVASARELPVATAFSAPLLGFGREEVPRIEMNPFGDLRQDGAVVHTGTDVGGCLDGAGIYAIADGVVRWIDGGGDAGVRLVVEHKAAPDELVNAIYMHADPTVFVAAGEPVAAGQLLGTIGLSFSIENGGQFAHLHFGMYRGAFRADHNHGYQPAGGDLDPWIDPARFLEERLDARKRP
jgi:murein DD-endopeptidase MepM/ murein hydrolase activator NlpD